MKLDDLKKFGLVYIATPFTLYEPDIEAAFVDSCKLMGGLLAAGVTNALSPIVEAYPISLHGNLDPLDLSIWKPFCAARIAKSDALVVGMLPGWERSTGTRHEIDEFVMAGKPVYFMSPDDLSYEPCSSEERGIFLESGRAK